MGCLGSFLISFMICSAAFYLVWRRITKKIAYYEYKHGEVRKWND